MSVRVYFFSVSEDSFLLWLSLSEEGSFITIGLFLFLVFIRGIFVFVVWMVKLCL